MLHDAADRDVAVLVAEGVDVDLVGAVEVLLYDFLGLWRGERERGESFFARKTFPDPRKKKREKKREKNLIFLTLSTSTGLSGSTSTAFLM